MLEILWDNFSDDISPQSASHPFLYGCDHTQASLNDFYVKLTNCGKSIGQASDVSVTSDSSDLATILLDIDDELTLESPLLHEQLRKFLYTYTCVGDKRMHNENAPFKWQPAHITQKVNYRYAGEHTSSSSIFIEITRSELEDVNSCNI